MTSFDELTTEQRRIGRIDLDLQSTAELVRLMNEENALVPLAVATALPAITAAIDAIAARLTSGGRLIYIGAGSAGRIGMLDASECRPTFNTPEGQVVGLIAGGLDAITRAVENAEDNASAGAGDLAALGLTARDAVVGIAASGRTPYVLGAMRYASKVGAFTVGVSCNAHAPLSGVVAQPIEVVPGPEFIAGSTRLKAGTAQKLVLNMISTIVMIRIGKTYNDLMVDIRVTNQKLHDRARRIVALIARCDTTTAGNALAAADGQVKTAVVMLQFAMTRDEAEALLASNNGNLRRALECNTRQEGAV